VAEIVNKDVHCTFVLNRFGGNARPRRYDEQSAEVQNIVVVIASTSGESGKANVREARASIPADTSAAQRIIIRVAETTNNPLADNLSQIPSHHDHSF
jgi:hypothetical protein